MPLARRHPAPLVATAIALAATLGCARTTPPPSPPAAAAKPALVGAWRSDVQFAGGAFAAIKDLQFLYAFDLGGTLTESSNYDGVPPVPPAYGVWKQTGPATFEALYEFFTTKPPAGLRDLTGGGGWLPSGRGVLTERITLAADGKSFDSTITLQLFDAAGRPIEGGSDAKGHAVRITL
jgi:hypothetical protein